MRFHAVESQKRGKYRGYSPTSMTNAYLKVKDDSMSVRRASKQFNVPITSLRDRVLGKIDAECVTTGRPPMFSMEDESKIVDHLKLVATYGYGYTRSEVSLIASDYAVQVGIRKSSNSLLTRGWLDGFFKRWPELRVLRPRSLEIARAKAASSEKVSAYFTNLSEIIEKYGLSDKPHLIYNVDEKGISPNHTPPSVVAPTGFQVPAVTSGKAHTTTIIGSGSASGSAIPPYFVFQGKRWNDDLLEGGCPGVKGTVSETGWSNSQVFRDYLENHFTKHCPAHDENHPILLLMDGHSTHVSVGLLEWAKSMNIVIFILPAHTSHLLQPLDVACYGPFQRMFNNECHKSIRMSSSVITKYNLCKLSCQVYYKALSSENLISGFKKCGIHPVDESVINTLALKPAEVFHVDQNVSSETTETTDVSDGVSALSEPGNVGESVQENVTNNFFQTRIDNLLKVKSTTKSKPRKCISRVISGKAVTEESTLQQIRDYEDEKPKKNGSKRSESTGKSQCKGKLKKRNMTDKIQSSPQPGPSHIRIDSSEDNTDDEITEEEKCCVCHKFTPDQIRNSISLTFTKWVQCTNDNCQHWVHLIYCTEKRVIRRGDTFFCPHCTENAA